MENRLALFDYHYTLAEALAAHEAAYERTVYDIFGIHGSMKDADSVASTIQTVVRAIAKKKGVPTNTVESVNEENIISTYHRHLESALELYGIKVLPDIPELLERLRDNQVVTAFLTGESKRTADMILQKIGLDGYFPEDMRSYASTEIGDSPDQRVQLIKLAISKAERKYGRFSRIYQFDDSKGGTDAGRLLEIITMGLGTRPGGYKELTAYHLETGHPIHLFRDVTHHCEFCNKNVLEIVLG